MMKESEEVRRLKLKRLKESLAKAEGDIVAGKGAILDDKEDIEAFFVNL
jgi:hypothetical protein